jgi:hypothetical protein
LSEIVTRCPACNHGLRPDLGLGPCKAIQNLTGRKGEGPKKAVCACYHVSHFTELVVQL